MTMYLLVFKQGQSALSAHPVGRSAACTKTTSTSRTCTSTSSTQSAPSRAARLPRARAPATASASRTCPSPIPAAQRAALRDVTLHIPPGQQARARRRERRRQDHADQAADAPLRADRRAHLARRARLCGSGTRSRCAQRIGVIFQDFIRYQLLVGENIGAGDVDGLRRRGRWQTRRGRWAWRSPSSSKLPEGYETQLGTLVRRRPGALGRPVAEDRAVARVHARGRRHPGARRAHRRHGRRGRGRGLPALSRLSESRMGIVISHRFSTVRMADQIVVLDDGAIVEQGTHEELMARTAATRGCSTCRPRLSLNSDGWSRSHGARRRRF